MMQLTTSLRRSARALARRVGNEEHGAVTVIVALMMVVILGMAALVVDVGSVEVRRAQLQDAADAAATAIAQDCFGAAGTTISLCDAGVRAAASSTALGLATRALPTGTVVTAGTPVFPGDDTVTVTLSSPDASTFGAIFGVSSSTVVVHATAKWGLPATPLALAYNECSLPAPSTASKSFLRYDLLDLDLQGCGLIGGVLNELGNGWLPSANCTFDVNLLSYLNDVLTKVLPTNCAPVVDSLIGKYVLLPVYSHVLTDIVVKGVLLGKGYAVQKYALVQVTGYDFQTLTLNALGNGIQAQIGPTNISGQPQCPLLVDLGPLLQIKEPTCQGLQGYFQGYLTPTEAAARMRGVQLIS
jgi:Flp pilus assembly protein TadG